MDTIKVSSIVEHKEDTYTYKEYKAIIYIPESEVRRVKRPKH